MSGARGGNRTHITAAYLATAIGVYKAPSLPILATRAFSNQLSYRPILSGQGDESNVHHIVSTLLLLRRVAKWLP